jgi:hypothetical protein
MQSTEIEEGENQADDSFMDANVLKLRVTFWAVF